MLSLCALLLAVASTVPVHVVRGIVIDAKSHAAVHGASVSLPNGKRVAVTDRAGYFRIEIPATPWPPSLKIAAPGLAERTVELPHVAGDANLKEIALSAAARIHAILPPAFGAESLKWTLYQVNSGIVGGRVVEGAFGRAHADVLIDGLAADNYVLVISGQYPLQQVATRVSPRPGDSLELPINLTPALLRLSVVSGKVPMKGATIRFAPHDFAWSGSITCDDDGNATAELWQQDDFLASFLDRGRIAFARAAHLRSDTGTISWTFDVPSHHVKGRVVDSVTREPLPDVNVRIRGTAFAEGGLEGLATRTDADGRFEFTAIKDGSHVVSAYKKGYRYDRVETITFEKDDGDWEGEIALDPNGDRPAVIVLDEGGRPLAGVEMFLATSDGGGVIMLEHTDEAGRVTLPPRGGVVYAVPREGSLGFTRVAEDQSTDVTLRVPRPAGTIDLVSQGTSGEPIPNLYFLLRINGTWIPNDVLARFVTMHSLPIRTDETGRARLSLLPAGLYELWPMRSDEDVSSLRAGHPFQGPATLAVGDVPQIVTMTFRKRPQG